MVYGNKWLFECFLPFSPWQTSVSRAQPKISTCKSKAFCFSEKVAVSLFPSNFPLRTPASFQFRDRDSRVKNLCHSSPFLKYFYYRPEQFQSINWDSPEIAPPAHGRRTTSANLRGKQLQNLCLHTSELFRIASLQPDYHRE